MDNHRSERTESKGAYLSLCSFNQLDLRSNSMATFGDTSHAIVDPPVRMYDAYYNSASADRFWGIIPPSYECMSAN